MKNKLYRLVSVEERVPDNSGDYTTDRGINYFSHSRKNFTEELTQDGGITYTMEVNPKWWLEEIELPSEEEITIEADKIDNWKESYEFERGANFILNHIKK